MTLADLELQKGDWYFVTTSPESTNKIVVTINRFGGVTSDMFLEYNKGSCFNPEKISKKEAGEFLKKAIPEFERDPNKNSTDAVLIKCMKRFYQNHFIDEECICPKGCDCQNPPPDDWDGKEGVYHISELCPVHNEIPRNDPNCPVHG